MPPRLQLPSAGFVDTLEPMKANDLFSSSGDTIPRNDDVVSRLRDSQIFRDYQQAFQTATGLPLVLRTAGSFQEPMHGAKNVNSFCTLMAAKSKTCAACLQLQQRAETAAVTGAATLECFSGLSESLVSIRLGEKTIAYLQTGQVLLREPSEKQFRSTVRQLAKWKADVDVAPLREAYFQTRVLPRAHYEATVRLLATFAQHLSMVANELMIRETAAEPPAVSKARAFIAEHLGEPLSLSQVAQAAHMSPFYFCKVFKTALGLTFTNYLARARVEKTKQLLLNQNTRASEAAYEAGFQSLSQFNRVFRRIVGESPSSYRENLHGATAGPVPRNPYAFAA
jgi:AraC-like DNA-binding protein/ligand-binding sensor protein